MEINNAARGLVRALSIMKEVKSDEAKAILTALKALAPVTADVDDGVSQSEIKALMASADTANPGPGARPAPGGGLGPPGPRPMAMAGMPFGMNQSVGAPGVG